MQEHSAASGLKPADPCLMASPRLGQVSGISNLELARPSPCQTPGALDTVYVASTQRRSHLDVDVRAVAGLLDAAGHRSCHLHDAHTASGQVCARLLIVRSTEQFKLPPMQPKCPTRSSCGFLPNMSASMSMCGRLLAV